MQSSQRFVFLEILVSQIHIEAGEQKPSAPEAKVVSRKFAGGPLKARHYGVHRPYTANRFISHEV